MRFWVFDFKHRAADVPARAPIVELPQLSLEDTALLNYNTMQAAALGRERQAIDQRAAS